MKTKVKRVFTPLLFMSLVALFVAYKSGYFDADKPEDIPRRALSGASFDQTSTLQHYSTQDILISSSKSMVATDKRHVVKNMNYAMQGIRKLFHDSPDTIPTGRTLNLDQLFSPAVDFLNDSTLTLDPKTREIAQRLDSLSQRRMMLMVSSKSLISVDQTRLADSLQLVLIKVLRLRVDSLKRNQNQ